MTSLHWIRKIDSGLQQIDRIPLAGNAPHFDLHAITSALRSQFGGSDLELAIHEAAWQESSKINVGFGANPLVLGISLSPLSGEVLWIMPRQDVAHLTSWLLNGKTRGKTISSELLQEGFYRFLAVNALDALQGLEPLKSFTLMLDDEASQRSEKAYCIDLQISFGERSCWGRLVIGEHLLTSWQRHFSSLRQLFSLSPVGKSLEIPLSISVGSVQLTQKEWKRVKKGDLVLLDQMHYEKKSNKGAATLVLGSTPLFHASIEENKIKLLNFAPFYEEPMDTKRKPEQQEPSEETPASPEEGKAVTVGKLPLFITVELARLSMTVDHLMKLSPGNFLELPIHPEQGVNLTVNGQKIGRGELVYLGEQLGIRILELAED